MLPADHAPVAPEALLGLGRLDGALSMAAPATLRLFVLRLLRDMLVTALRQEGHAFTDHRFHAWFAGVATLSDEPARMARPPRALCETILTELTHSSWDLMAQAAMRFQAALMAPSDHLGSSHVGSGHVGETAHQDAGSVIAAAHDLLAGLAPSPDPLAALARLHHAAGNLVQFAPSEQAAVPIAIGPDARGPNRKGPDGRGAIRLLAERMALPSPRWALEMLWGEYWQKTGHLTHALPFPGLVRLDVLRTNRGADRAWDIDDLDDTPTTLATALRDVTGSLNTSLSEADRLARRLADCQPGQRRSSRAPALLELLTGFGPLRSAQLETLLGVTRLGLRTMLGAASTVGLLDRTTLAGVHLYTVNLEARVRDDGNDLAALHTFSPAVLDEYDAAMRDIDALLARSGVNLDEQDEP